jgi:hypothetical protein
MTDQVPLGAGEITQGVTLSGKLLDTILAKDAQSGFVGLADWFRWEGLAHRHEGDFFGIASDAAGCLINALANSSNVLCNGHIGSGTNYEQNKVARSTSSNRKQSESLK